MSPAIHLKAERLVRERKAPDYRTACAMIARRPKRPPPVRTPPPPPREIRLPYRDD